MNHCNISVILFTFAVLFALFSFLFASINHVFLIAQLRKLLNIIQTRLRLVLYSLFIFFHCFLLLCPSQLAQKLIMGIKHCLFITERFKYTSCYIVLIVIFFLMAPVDFYLFILFIPSLIFLSLLPFLCDNVKFILLLYWINKSTNNNNIKYLCCAY